MLVRLREEEVEQAVEGDHFVRLRKELLRLQRGDGQDLSIVRKHLAGVTPSGVVLLVHGFAQNRYTWHLSTRSFANHLAAKGFDVYNLELHGHGRSRDYGSRPASAFDQYVEGAVDAVGATLALAGAERLFLVGHSLGGAVCYAAASRCSAQVAGVVTIAGLYRFGSNPATRNLARALGALSRFEAPLRSFSVGVKSRYLGRLLSDWWRQVDELGKVLPLSGWAPGSTEPHVLQERLVRGFDWTGINILLTMMRWVSDGRIRSEDGEDFGAAFARLNLPLLVVAGDRDRLLPPADARPAFDESLSEDKQWVLFSPVRHAVHWGHLDLILGRHAPVHVWPLISGWLDARRTRC